MKGSKHSPAGFHRREGRLPTDDVEATLVAARDLHRAQTSYSRLLEKHLLRFGDHADDCDPASTQLRACACGWLQAIAEVWPYGKPAALSETAWPYGAQRAEEAGQEVIGGKLGYKSARDCPDAAFVHSEPPADMDEDTDVSPTRVQRKCPTCDFWSVWAPREEAGR